MIKAVILERKSLKNTFKLMVKLFWGSGELHLVKHTFGPNRPLLTIGRPTREEKPMPKFAQFIALRGTDEAFTVTGGRLFTFDLPDLDLTDLPDSDLKRTVILMFKVSGPSGTRLQMTVNPAGGGPQIDFELDSTFTAPRSWHEIVQESVFQVANNHLIVESNSAKVSDIVVLYHAKTL
jgi:hypothetical protein